MPTGLVDRTRVPSRQNRRLTTERAVVGPGGVAGSCHVVVAEQGIREGRQVVRALVQRIENRFHITHTRYSSKARDAIRMSCFVRERSHARVPEAVGTWARSAHLASLRAYHQTREARVRYRGLSGLLRADAVITPTVIPGAGDEPAAGAGRAPPAGSRRAARSS